MTEISSNQQNICEDPVVRYSGPFLKWTREELEMDLRGTWNGLKDKKINDFAQSLSDDIDYMC